MDKTEARLTLAIDAMGSDRGPEEILEGVAQAVEVSPRSTEFMLFGREEILSSFVEGNSVLSNARVSIRHAPEVVGMDEKPIAGIKGKKNSSMSLALLALKDGEADAMLSCGNTGCLMAGGPGLAEVHFQDFGTKPKGRRDIELVERRAGNRRLGSNACRDRKESFEEPELQRIARRAQ